MPVADVCASFQEAVVDVLTAKTVRAATELGLRHGGHRRWSRGQRPAPALAAERCAAAGLTLRVPRPGLCTDNGAMIAALGAHVVRAGVVPSAPTLGGDPGMPVGRVVAA